MIENRFYRDKIVDPEIEDIRLADKFPTEVLISLLEPEIKRIGRVLNVLDLGSGSNPALGEFISGMGSRYYSLDLQHRHAKKQTAAGNFAVQGDIESIPFPTDVFEITHKSSNCIS